MFAEDAEAEWIDFTLADDTHAGAVQAQGEAPNAGEKVDDVKHLRFLPHVGKYPRQFHAFESRGARATPALEIY